MKTLRTAAAALAVGTGLFSGVPATAQITSGVVDAQQLSAAERVAFRPLMEAYRLRDWAGVQAALPGASSAASTAAGRYVIGQVQFETGLNTRSIPLQSTGIETMLASGGAPAQSVRGLQQNQVALSLLANEPARAEQQMTRIVEANPGDPLALAQLAEIKLRLFQANERTRAPKRAEAVALYQRAGQAADASGRALPESFYRRAAAVAADARVAPVAAELGQRLVTRYPTPTNWRDVLLSYRDLNPGDAELNLDVLRLLSRTGGLAGERDYLEAGRAFNEAGRGIEARAILDQGVQAGMLSTSEAAARDLVAAAGRRAATERTGLAALRTQSRSATTGRPARQLGDSLLGQDQFAEAVEAYRLALQKGGEDQELINTRLGLALGLAGQRAEAEASLRSVTGARQPLAALVLAYLARRTG